MSQLTFNIRVNTGDVDEKIKITNGLVSDLKTNTETPKVLNLSTQQALASIRDVKIAVDGVMQIVNGLTRAVNDFLDSSLKQQQAITLTNRAFKEQSSEIQALASGLQAVTNYGDEQLLPLMAKLRQTYKLSTSEIKELTPVILDFAEANKATGMTVETAFDLMGRAVNGHTEMLGRYGLELDKTKLETEGVSYLTKQLAKDYGGTAQALADLRTQNKNTWGDIKEQIGDMLNVIISPLLKGIREVFRWYQDLSPVMKGFVTSLALSIPVIASVTTAITVLTTAFIALKSAINPVAGIISLVVASLAAAGFGYASYRLSVDSAKQSQKEYNQELTLTDERLNKLMLANREYAESLNYSQAKRELQSVSEEIDKLLAKQGTTREAEVFIIFDTSDYARLQELYIQEGALREKIRVDDLQAQKQYAEYKSAIDKEMSLSEVELIAYQLQQHKLKYDSLGDLDTENLEQKKELYAKIKELEAKLTEFTQQETEQRLLLQQKYTVLTINNEVERQIKQLEIEEQTELERAKTINASEETIYSIRLHFSNKKAELLRKERERAEANVLANLERARQEEIEKQRILEEFSWYRQMHQERTMEAELNAVDAFYDKRREKYLQAGITEQQITENIEKAKESIVQSYQLRALQGSSSFFGNLASMANAFGEKGFKFWQAMAMTQALVDTYSSATAAYKAMAGIPIIGPGLAIAASIAAIGAGLANVSMISKQKPPKMELGGLLKGKSHAEGGIVIEAEGEEYITRKSRVKELGANFMDFINYAPINVVKGLLSGLNLPNIPIPAQVNYAYGGSVVESNNIGGLLSELMALKTEVINLQNEVKNKNLSVNNYISANDVIKTADSTLISEKSEQGKIIRSTF